MWENLFLPPKYDKLCGCFVCFVFFPPGRQRWWAGRHYYRMLRRGSFPKVDILMMMLSQRQGMRRFMRQFLFVCTKPAERWQESGFLSSPYPVPTPFLFSKYLLYCTSHGQPQPRRPCLQRAEHAIKTQQMMNLHKELPVLSQSFHKCTASNGKRLTTKNALLCRRHKQNPKFWPSTWVNMRSLYRLFFSKGDKLAVAETVTFLICKAPNISASKYIFFFFLFKWNI